MLTSRILVFRGYAANSAGSRTGMPHDCGNDGRRSIDIGPVDVRFYAYDDMARLNLGAGCAAKHPAGKRNAELVKPVGQYVERILITRCVTTVHANIKSRPVVDVGDHGGGWYAGAIGRSAACAEMKVANDAVAATIAVLSFFMPICLSNYGLLTVTLSQMSANRYAKTCEDIQVRGARTKNLVCVIKKSH